MYIYTVCIQGFARSEVRKMPEEAIAKKKAKKIEEEAQTEENMENIEEAIEECVEETPAESGPYPVGVLRKLNQIRGMTLTMDWTPDKVMKIGSDRSKWYPYLSVDRMKSLLNPAFAKAGLEVVPCYEDIAFRGAIGNMSQHVTLMLVIDVVDIDTGAYIRYRVPGEAGDSGDKALSKAGTYALKGWLSGTFMLGEGFDPNMTESDESSDGFPARPTLTEAVEMKSKVLDGGVKPAVKAPKAPEAPKAAAPAPKAKTDGKKPTLIQEATMKKICDSWAEAAREGKVGAERYNAMSEARASVSTQSDAVDFIADFEKVA